MFVMCCKQLSYVDVVSRGGIYICIYIYIYIFAIVMCLVLLMCTLTILKLCVVCIYGRRYVCCSECNGVSDEFDEPSSYLVQPVGSHGGEVEYFWSVCFRGEHGFLNCDDICMCVVNNQFKLLEFVSESVYVDLQYDEISLTFTAGPVCLCGVSSPVVVLGLFMRLS